MLHSGRGLLNRFCSVNSFVKAMLNVVPIPALSDNYMYLVIDNNTNECAVVDPVEPDKVVEHVQKLGVTLRSVLTTHHHWDHAGGNEKMVEKVKGLQVYGGDDRIGALTDKIGQGFALKIGELDCKCLFTPCHTTGHICYYVTDSHDNRVVFTGDTLFIGGCGRFFEGNAEQMYNALVKNLGSLPDDTKVYCGHEYAIPNLTYARHADPSNVALKEKFEWAKKIRAENKFSVPSSIGEEKTINPFMRVGEPSLREHTKQTDPIQVMHALREEKNNFKC